MTTDLTVRLHSGDNAWTVQAGALYIRGSVYLFPGLQPGTIDIPARGLQARATVYEAGTPRQWTDLELERLP